MKVDVTQDDIDRGTSHSATLCPIARALIRTTGDTMVFVGKYEATVGLGDSKDAFLPLSARQFIDHFDRFEPVSPFTFELDL